MKYWKPPPQPKYSDAELCAMFDSTPSTPLKSSTKSKSPKKFIPKPTFIDSAGVHRNLKNVTPRGLLPNSPAGLFGGKVQKVSPVSSTET